MIEYHSYNAGGLACRLKCPPGRSKPPTAGKSDEKMTHGSIFYSLHSLFTLTLFLSIGLSHGKWEIDPTELTLLEELGSGGYS